MIIYDSILGNTERIAQSVAAGLGSGAKAVRVGAADTGALADLDLLVVGSPTLGGRPTPGIKRFLERVAAGGTRVPGVAAFDTRLTMAFARVFGYAAPRIAEKLEGEGSALRCPPEGFVVKGRNGPLAEGEAERAERWGKALRA
ncbi:MAG TPA: flavodoxin domain-containing protein [bacterium]|nr:flavodoxin domain-containing protein [bacterium]